MSQRASFCAVCEYTYETDGAVARGWFLLTWCLMAAVGLANALFFTENLIIAVLMLFVPLAMGIGFHVSVSCGACSQLCNRRKREAADRAFIEEAEAFAAEHAPAVEDQAA